MKTGTCIIFITICLISISSYAQLTVKDQESTPNTLLQVNDEGSAGSLTLPPLSTIGAPENKLYNIGTSLYWNGTALATSGSAGGWTDDGVVVRLSSPTDKVGIGITSPSALLHVTGDDGVLFTRGSGSGVIPVEGDGTRMMWYPPKAALRVGTVVGPDLFNPSTCWNDANIGYASVAMGFNTTASGDHSFTMGAGSIASGNNSAAMGNATLASGENSIALGQYSKAASLASMAIGYNNIGGGSADVWIFTDPLFEIGYGITGVPENAFTVLKNGNVGIGIHDPSYKLDINGGDLLIRGSSGNTGTLHLGTVHHYIKGVHGFGLKLGTYVAGDVIFVKELSGNVGINTDTPDAKLDVNGTVKVGTGGSIIHEIQKVTGTISPTGITSISYPSGFTKANTNVLSLGIYMDPYWVSSGYEGENYCELGDTAIIIMYSDANFQGNQFRLVLMRID